MDEEESDIGQAEMAGLTIVDSYQHMPVEGDDVIYFCKDLNSVCKWSVEAQDWKAMSMEHFAPHLATDMHNDRRAAIRDQKARKKHEQRRR